MDPLCLIRKIRRAAGRRMERLGQVLVGKNAPPEHPKFTASVDPSVRFMPTAVVENMRNDPALVKVGRSTVIRGQLTTFAHGGQIQIGEYCYVGEGTRIWSAASIVIGNRVLISHGVNIHDTDSHPFDTEARHQHYKRIIEQGHPTLNEFGIISTPVIIEDDVWICFGSSILKGVTVGKGSIVAACAVVTRDVVSGVIVAGNPARIVRKLPT
jgi:acetyltransferase-like isoleucine patch superfamily enzyme